MLFHYASDVPRVVGWVAVARTRFGGSHAGRTFARAQRAGREPPRLRQSAQPVSESNPPKAGAQRVGLCLTCRHSRRIETPRSVFLLCGLSAVDPRFPKYPALPVIECGGYERKSEPEAP